MFFQSSLRLNVYFLKQFIISAPIEHSIFNRDILIDCLKFSSQLFDLCVIILNNYLLEIHVEKALLVKIQIQKIRGVFRTLSNIYHGAFLQK